MKNLSVICVLGIALAIPAAADAGSLEPVAYAVPDGISNLSKNAAGVVLRDGAGRFHRISGVDGHPVLTLLPDHEPAKPVREGMLPDGEVSVGARGIKEAWLTGPTERYAHGVLGDAIEAGGLHAVSISGDSMAYTLDPGSVFEDLKARLADLDGDSQDEIVVVRSYLDRGAALSVLAIDEGKLQVLAETEPIGRPQRWLNPIGVADFDNDGKLEVALVVTPHLRGVLKLYELRDGKLHEEFSGSGFSNHAIGSRELGMSAVVDLDGDDVPDLLVPALDHSTLRAVSFATGLFFQLGEIQHKARISTALVTVDLDEDGRDEVLYGLADGTLMVLRRR